MALLYSPPAFPPCPHPLTLESPDTLDGGFPSGPRPSGSPHESNVSLASHSPKSLARTTGAVAPGVQGVTLLDTDVFCWCVIVFSSNTTDLSSSPFSGKARLFFFYQIYSAVKSFHSFSAWNAAEIPPFTRRLGFRREGWTAVYVSRGYTLLLL